MTNNQNANSSAPRQPLTSAVVLVFDQLSAGYLGPYGNTWIETPHFNRLAAESLLSEFAWTDTVELDWAYRSLWQGRHAAASGLLEPNLAAGSEPMSAHNGGRPHPAWLPVLLRERGVVSTLISDDSSVCRMGERAEFDQVVALPEPTAEWSADSLEEAGLARSVAAALEQLSGLREPFLVWIHLRALAGPWDAPYVARQALADEEDPEPPSFVEPPRGLLPLEVDPDEQLGWFQAYAAQVGVLDECLGAMLDLLEAQTWWPRTWLAATATRGCPLGDHGYMGDFSGPLYSDALHIPCLMRWPDGTYRMRRLQTLWQPPDLYATLLSELGCQPPDASTGTPLRQLLNVPPDARKALSIGPGGKSLRNAAWLLVSSTDGEFEAFSKPDDRWDANEVAARCPELHAIRFEL